VKDEIRLQRQQQGDAVVLVQCVLAAVMLVVWLRHLLWS
jgi:hypothetical protein